MLVNDQDVQVLYEACSSKDCTKACNKEVGATVACLFCRRSFLDHMNVVPRSTMKTNGGTEN